MDGLYSSYKTREHISTFQYKGMGFGEETLKSEIFREIQEFHVGGNDKLTCELSLPGLMHMFTSDTIDFIATQFDT